MPPGVSVRLEGVVKSFDGGLVKALRGVSLEVAAGDSVAIMGPTGCGKSTLLSIVGLLDTPDSGAVFLDGHPAADFEPAEDFRATRVGFVFQFHHLLPHLSVVENVELPLAGRAGRAAARARATEALALVGLEHRARTLAARVSGGERQLAALARALVVKPALILADEPTGSVDSETGARILALLEGWSATTSGTLLLVSHDTTVASRCRRLVKMRDGAVANAA
ncbi:MAG: ABC transporter ATP-binding protein [Acidobacteria bacterium]|nr:ABC transporter ATP-binding protein [Acidobacteriota bacterium]